MSWPSYSLCIDWDNDGSFATAGDDISNDVMRLWWSRGRDAELERATAGILEITLKNPTGEYSPSNSGGTYYGKLLPGRPVRLQATFGVTTYDLWYGKIERIVPKPHWQDQTCYIYCVDGFDMLKRAEITTDLYTDELTGTLVGNILDEVGWAAGDRDIEVGIDTVPLGYWSQVSALYALQEIEESECGFFYIDHRGYARFEDRHYRMGLSSSETITDEMCDISYDLSSRGIYNSIMASYTEKTLGVEAELWRLSEVPLLAAGETRTWWGDYQGLATNQIDPAATTDYTANMLANGTGADMTASVTVTPTHFAGSTKLVVVNGAGVAVYLTLLKVRGDLYSDGDKTSVKSDDSTSQTAYQKRDRTLDAQFLASVDQCQQYCDFVLSETKDAWPDVDMTLKNRSDTVLTAMLNRKISDRITVQNTELGLDDDYFINAVQHDVDMKMKTHKCKWTLRSATPELFWVLDLSELDSTTKLAY
jgi:hypothetical protein